MAYRFILEKGSKKHICPSCGKKTFVRYINQFDKGYLPEQYGRCDRQDKCQYHLNPYKDKYHSKTDECGRDKTIWKLQKIVEDKKVHFDPYEFKQTLHIAGYDYNNFMINLVRNHSLPIEDVFKVATKYGVGTIANGKNRGATTFPFINQNNNVRAVQVKAFDKSNHTAYTTWLHSIIEMESKGKANKAPKWIEDYKQQKCRVDCLFGEHLIENYPSNPVVIVESPKNALYGALYFGFPTTSNDLLWLSVFNKDTFEPARLKVLNNRTVYVIPDTSLESATYNEWIQRARGCILHAKLRINFIFSRILEDIVTNEQRQGGYDIADYLAERNWKDFRGKKLEDISRVEKVSYETVAISEAPTVDLPAIIDLPTVEDSKINVPVVEDNTVEGNPVVDMVRTMIDGVIKLEFRLPPPPLQLKELAERIAKLEAFFNEDILYPNAPMQLDAATVVTDYKKFVQSHLATLKCIKTERQTVTYLPFLARLEYLKAVLEPKDEVPF